MLFFKDFVFVFSGKGAFAWVKEAIWAKTGNRFALKFTKKFDGKGERTKLQKKEVKMELTALTRIKHP